MIKSSAMEEPVRASPIQALLFALSLAGYPLIAILPTFFNIDTQRITIPYRAFVLFVSAVAIFILVRNRTKIFKSKFWFYFLTFWCLYGCRLFYELVLADNMLRFKPEEYLLFTFGITLLPAIVFAFPTNAATLKLARQLTFVIAVSALVGNLAVGWEAIFTSGFSRFNTEALNPVSFAVLGSLTILIGLTNILADPQPTGRSIILKNMIRTTYFMGIGLGLVVIFVSGSRGPLLATGACAAIMLGVSLRENIRNAVVVVPIAFIATIVMVIFGTEAITTGTLFARFRSFATLEDQSDTDRLDLWQGALSQFLESPMLGSGLEEQSFLYYPHNIPLEAFMATGIIGGICFSIILVWSLYRTFALLKLPAQYSWVAVIYLALAMMALFAGSIWGAGSLVHMMLAVMAMPVGTKISKRFKLTQSQMRATPKGQTCAEY
jgi:O-antigen ligase